MQKRLTWSCKPSEAGNQHNKKGQYKKREDYTDFSYFILFGGRKTNHMLSVWLNTTFPCFYAQLHVSVLGRTEHLTQRHLSHSDLYCDCTSLDKVLCGFSFSNDISLWRACSLVCVQVSGFLSSKASLMVLSTLILIFICKDATQEYLGNCPEN